ncbi:hypothetical protein K8I85_04685 [bacterium]|nr:hypothetical protein [bacterium]
MTGRSGKTAADEAMLDEIAAVGREFRHVLRPVLEAVGGVPPRPAAISRETGLDKSLASRLVRAVRSRSDLELMHLIPSPTGLRKLADLMDEAVDPALTGKLITAIDEFQRLLDGMAGGRAAVDALISEQSVDVRRNREHIAKQASFKSMSFLLGHFCETLVSQIFLVPGRNGNQVDAIEIQRRIGLRRMRPGAQLALLSYVPEPENEDAFRIEHLGDNRGLIPAESFLLPEHCSDPLPPIEVVHDGMVTTLVLGEDPSRSSDLTSATFLRNGWVRKPKSDFFSVRGYVLHIPCRTLVRDLFIADSLFPGVTPRVSFNIPGPGANTHPPYDDRRPHFSAVDLTASIEQQASGTAGYEMSGVGDSVLVTKHALELAGHGETRFRGWRCALTYPVPLVEMVWWLAVPPAEE